MIELSILSYNEEKRSKEKICEYTVRKATKAYTI